MANFRTHVTTSTLLGFGYAGAGYAAYGVPLDTAIVGGALCGFSGMLPDLDSDYGVPLRETMAFTAAVVPMLLVGRFQSVALSYDAMVLITVGLYLFVRFGVTKMIRTHTVHRGMFHSVPAGLIFAGIAFLVCGGAELSLRYYKAVAVFAGFMSHLLLDEIYAVEWKSGRWRFKKSFGTALKFWGTDEWANFSTYSKLAVIAVLILGEPTVMERLEVRSPSIATQYRDLHDRFQSLGGFTSMAQDAIQAARGSAGNYLGASPPELNGPPPLAGGGAPGGIVPEAYGPLPPGAPFEVAPGQPATIRDGYDTAHRPQFFPQ